MFYKCSAATSVLWPEKLRQQTFCSLVHFWFFIDAVLTVQRFQENFQNSKQQNETGLVCYRRVRCPDSCDRRSSFLQSGMSRFMCIFLKQEASCCRRNGKHCRKSPGISPLSVLSLFYCLHHSPENQQPTSRKQACVSSTPAHNLKVLRVCENEVSLVLGPCFQAGDRWLVGSEVSLAHQCSQ